MAYSVRKQVRDQVLKDIQQLGLRRINNNVTSSPQPFSQINVRPGCYLTTEPRKRGDGDSHHNEYGYVFLVSLIQGKAGIGYEREELWYKWLEQLVNKYEQRRFSFDTRPSNVLVLTCSVDEVDVQDDRLDKLGFAGSFVEITVWLHEQHVTS